ncbi:MAG: SPOR domain-containing protein [Bacteroidetes bacterium]|jgi:hypothetical protein|nr:SPOR domain-containing protein [Bacteroidota bacterium]MDF1863770.1 SPOR domain-containing protein [Saprospiraceae bacterium]
MKYIFLLATILYFSNNPLFAQGTITVSSEAKISKMMDRFVEINQSKKFIEGWRIQLLATSDRQRVETAKVQFQSLYPNIYADWKHTAPYYKLRAGAFASKLDAIRMLYVLKQDYPTAYPTRDNSIRPSELISGL